MAVCESSSCLLLCEHFEFEQLMAEYLASHNDVAL